MGELHFPEFGASIRWSETGEGRPLVILPALSVQVVPSFAAMIAESSLADRRFILIDYLGSGASDHPENFDYGLASHARCVAAVMSELGLQSADVLGHSMGGTVAIRLALDFPELVGRLVIGEGNLDPKGGAASSRIVREKRTDFASWSYPALCERMEGDVATWLLRAWEPADPQGIWRNAEALVKLDPGFRAAFLGMAVPRTFIYGEKSLERGFAADVPDPAALREAGVRVAVVSGVGHSMFQQNPSESAVAVAAAFPPD